MVSPVRSSRHADADQVSAATVGSSTSDDDMLVVESLVKAYRGARETRQESVMAVSDVSFKVSRGKLFTLLGPSGCGKTTTLRCIAGLETPDEGEITVDAKVLFSSRQRLTVPANRRGLGMVFQSYAIWPHMNVSKNVAYPLETLPRAKRPSKRQINDRVERVLTSVELDHLASRRATDLSGGQQQRLALARALVMEPPLLLLDEPLSNLDAKLREGMRLELKRLQRDLGITCLYVTHDQVEALAMSNFIAVLDSGVIQQVGRPREIYERPANRFVAGFIGTSNFIEGTVVQIQAEGGRYVVETAQGPMQGVSQGNFLVGDEVSVSVRPEHVSLVVGQEQEIRPNVWHGQVRARAFLGEAVDHVVDVGGVELRARTHSSVSIAEGEDVTCEFSAESCNIVAAS